LANSGQMDPDTRLQKSMQKVSQCVSTKARAGDFFGKASSFRLSHRPASAGTIFPQELPVGVSPESARQPDIRARTIHRTLHNISYGTLLVSPMLPLDNTHVLGGRKRPASAETNERQKVNLLFSIRCRLRADGDNCAAEMSPTMHIRAVFH
jgi:hypothetical protein